jgi:hypothetical protein
LHGTTSPQWQHPQARHDRGYAILFERTGGYTGSHDRFWIYLDGRVEDERGVIKEIASTRAIALSNSIGALLSTGAHAAPAKITFCCDCFRYRITIPTGKGVRSVVLSEPLRVKSDNLARLVQELRDLVSSRKNHPPP